MESSSRRGILKVFGAGGLAAAFAWLFPEAALAAPGGREREIRSSQRLLSAHGFRPDALPAGVRLSGAAIQELSSPKPDTEADRSFNSVVHRLSDGTRLKSTGALLEDGTVVILNEEYRRNGTPTLTKVTQWRIEGSEAVAVAMGSDLSVLRADAGAAPTVTPMVTCCCGTHPCSQCTRMDWYNAASCCSLCWTLMNGKYPTNPRLFILCVMTFCPLYCYLKFCTQWTQTCCNTSS